MRMYVCSSGWIDRDMMNQNPCGLVVMGGSTGGLEALLVLLEHLRQDYRIPTILVLHQRANRVSGVPELLAAKTHLRVQEAEDKQPIEWGTLYVAPPNYHLLVEKEKMLSLSCDAPVNYCRPAIDVTFETAAAAYGAALTVCVLSGANQDGARGAADVKRRGGRVLVQSRAEAMMAVMPAAALAATSVDAEIDMPALADLLSTLVPAGGG